MAGLVTNLIRDAPAVNTFPSLKAAVVEFERRKLGYAQFRCASGYQL